MSFIYFPLLFDAPLDLMMTFSLVFFWRGIDRMTISIFLRLLLWNRRVLSKMEKCHGHQTILMTFFIAANDNKTHSNEPDEYERLKISIKNFYGGIFMTVLMVLSYQKSISTR